MIQQMLTLVALLALWVSVSHSSSLRERRSVIPGTLSVCPTMRCVGVDPHCQFMEVIAFRFEIGHSKDMWVECLGCPYCIDVPADYLDRVKRSTPEVDQPKVANVESMNEVLPSNVRFRRAARRAHLSSPRSQTALCRRVTCPVPPPDSSCVHPGLLEGYLRDRPCISCPICLDAN